MFNWFKTKVVAPAVGFFKSLFGFKQVEDKVAKLEKDLAWANKTIEALSGLYDNLSEGNRELIHKYNKESEAWRKDRAENKLLRDNYDSLFTKMSTLVQPHDVASIRASALDATSQIDKPRL